jgi:hypothetical protein
MRSGCVWLIFFILADFLAALADFFLFWLISLLLWLIFSYFG